MGENINCENQYEQKQVAECEPLYDFGCEGDEEEEGASLDECWDGEKKKA